MKNRVSKLSKRTPWSDQKLLDYSEEHIYYEIDMFRNVGKALRVPRKAGGEVNVLVESFGIHLRNLIHFFYPDLKPDDVIAAEFLVRPEDWESLPAISDELSAARERANKELMHLTRQRKPRADPEKGWEPAKLADEIKRIVVKFVKVASPTRLHSKVVNYVNDWEAGRLD